MKYLTTRKNSSKIVAVLEWLFGCRHRKVTRPMATEGMSCHLTCLTCGQQWWFDPVRWQIIGKVTDENRISAGEPELSGRSDNVIRPKSLL